MTDKTDMVPVDVRRFASVYGLPSSILDRCSVLFLLELFSYHSAYGINPRSITEEILVLEGLDHRPRGTRRAEKFRHEALRGLMKKHWFTARFIPQNVLNVLQNGGFDHVIEGILDPAAAPLNETHDEYVERLSSELARLSVQIPIQQRQRARKLSGEWIVFAPHQTGNHYLSISTHREGDAAIREKIVRTCVPEFPFLREVLRLDVQN